MTIISECIIEKEGPVALTGLGVAWLYHEYMEVEKVKALKKLEEEEEKEWKAILL